MRPITQILWRDWPLAVKLTVITIVLTVAPLVVVTYYNTQQQESALLDASRHTSYQRAQATALAIQAIIDRHRGDIQALAGWLARQSYDLDQPADQADLSAMLHQTRQSFDFYALHILNSSGRVIVSTDAALIRRDMITDLAFRTAASGEVYVGDVFICPWCRVPVISFSAPVHNIDGGLWGVVIGWVNFNAIDQLVSLDSVFAGQQGYGMLWDADGIILAGGGSVHRRLTPLTPLPSDVTQEIVAAQRFGAETEALLSLASHETAILDRSRMLLYDATASPFVRVTTSDRHVMSTVIVPMTQQRWLYGISIPESTLLDEVSHERGNTWPAAVVAALIAVITGLLLAKSIVDPVHAVAHAAQALTAGLWVGEIDTRSRDEIGQLAASYNTMSRSLEQRTRDLSASERRYRAIVEDQTELICRYTLPDGILTFVNEAYCRNFEKSTEELIGTPFFTLLAPEDRQPVAQRIASLSPNHPMNTLVLQVFIPHLGSRWQEWTNRLIVSQNEANVEIQAVGRDITERKRAEISLQQTLAREIELNEVKARFLSVASHDLRGPLAVIQSTSDLLRVYGDRLSEESRLAKFEKIQANVRHMTEMINGVLLINRGESGKLECHPEEIDLQVFCQDAIDELSLTTGQDHHFDFTLEGTPAATSLDPVLLRHIVDNLLSNAVKYSPSGSAVFLTLGFDDGQVRLTVRDQGIGIPPGDQKQLFSTFYRASNVGHTPGNGLGLAIVKQSVEAHGGSIRFESREGEGTTFTVSLPAQPAA